MRGTLDAAFELNQLIKYLWFKNYRTKIKYSLKKEGAFNSLREDTTPRNSSNRRLCSNCWVTRGTLLPSI